MRRLGVMDSPTTFRYGDEVVARTDRGVEIGTVLCEATPAAIDAMPETTQGSIVRRKNADDARQWRHLQSLISDDLTICRRHIQRLGLAMKLVEIERILGGEKLVVYYTAEQRVDFRQLVRDLAREFKTRIEMRQIGVRDEAKLLADYGDCGQPICCSRFLSKMPPVSMKMAKIQKATLDPTKISGRCGRLKCCLRYEFEGYQERAKELPPVDSRVLTREGSADVVAVDILSGQISVRNEDGRRYMIGSGDIISIQKGNS